VSRVDCCALTDDKKHVAVSTNKSRLLIIINYELSITNYDMILSYKRSITNYRKGLWFHAKLYHTVYYMRRAVRIQ
jgi:hypothetical protein